MKPNGLTCAIVTELTCCTIHQHCQCKALSSRVVRVKYTVTYHHRHGLLYDLHPRDTGTMLSHVSEKIDMYLEAEDVTEIGCTNIGSYQKLPRHKMEDTVGGTVLELIGSIFYSVTLSSQGHASQFGGSRLGLIQREYFSEGVCTYVNKFTKFLHVPLPIFLYVSYLSEVDELWRLINLNWWGPWSRCKWM